MFNILALCSSYNRSEITIRALASLKNQLLDGINLKIVVVDDCSTDGTGELLGQRYPDILIVPTNRSMYWAGAMRHGYKNSWDPNRFHFLLAFNDDCIFKENAISQLVDVYLHRIKIAPQNKAIVVVGTLADNNGLVTYGGLTSTYKPLNFRAITPNGSTQEAATLNMNLALISREALELAPFMRTGYVHGYADYDFGLSLKRAGGSIYVAPEIIGECSRNTKLGTWEDNSLNFVKRIKDLFGPKGMPIKQRWLFLRTNVSLLMAILIFPHPYIKFFIKCMK